VGTTSLIDIIVMLSVCCRGSTVPSPAIRYGLCDEDLVTHLLNRPMCHELWYCMRKHVAKNLEYMLDYLLCLVSLGGIVVLPCMGFRFGC
jgi:hypothetical protein